MGVPGPQQRRADRPLARQAPRAAAPLAVRDRHPADGDVPLPRRGGGARSSMVGGLPCIIKLIQGTQGVGVMIANTDDGGGGHARHALDARPGDPPAGARRASRAARTCARSSSATGWSPRCAAPPAPGEFRSNIHRGRRRARRSTLDREYAEAAVKAARVMGLEVAGVDMLEARSGPKIMEVNSSPGLRGARGRDRHRHREALRRSTRWSFARTRASPGGARGHLA